MVAAASSKEKPLLYGLLKSYTCAGERSKSGVDPWVDLMHVQSSLVGGPGHRARARGTAITVSKYPTTQVPSALAVSWSPKERRRGKEIVYLAARDWDV